MIVLSVVGARPNFMKVAPLHRAFESRGLTSHIVHTGQHYDEQMSDIFFEQLGLPEPDVYLGVGSGSHATQTGQVMTAFGPVLREESPDWVVVVGDVNSTLACTLVAVKEHVRVAHVEAGLRSGDRRMPEEINRLATDRIADRLFVTEESGVKNLRREGVAEERIAFVGNVMIDTLVACREAARETQIVDHIGLENGRYVVMTMHRPSNVDNRDGLVRMIEIIERITEVADVVFPMHPRTEQSLVDHRLDGHLDTVERFHWLEPLGYLEFLRLMDDAGAVMTDSGGIQEETTFLGIPCLTLRSSTERPVTVTEGTDTLMGDAPPKRVAEQVRSALAADRSQKAPPKWDGHTAERIAEDLLRTTE